MNISALKKHIIGKLEKELSPKLTYHGVQHTLAVLRACEQYIKRMRIAPGDAFLLRTAAIMHDTGYLEAHDNHEERSIKYVREILPEWNYSGQQIEIINGIIRATKIPQTPTTVLEQIIGDADLDYLGTDLFYKIGNKLFIELKNLGAISTEEEWNKLQIAFLQKHSFHTPFAKKNREPVKQKYLKEIIDKWGRNN